MAQIPITVPDEYLDRVLEAFDEAFPGRDEIGATKPQWVKKQINAFIKETVKASEIRKAIAIAAAEAAAGAEEIEIT